MTDMKIDCEALLEATELCKAHFSAREDQTQLKKTAGEVYLLSLQEKKNQNVDERQFFRQLSLIFDNDKQSSHIKEQNPALWKRLEQIDISFGLDAIDEMYNLYYESDERGV